MLTQGVRQFIVVPNLTIGGNVVNYIVEVYMTETYIKRSGIAARCGGWHERPVVGVRFQRKPYNTEVVAAERIERWLEAHAQQGDIIESW